MMKSISCDPKIWGKHFWRTMEIIACTMTADNQTDVIHMMNHLQTLLPCEKCRSHYQHYLKNNPVHQHVQSPIHLLRWIYTLQCIIKQRQSRSCASFQEFLDGVVEYFDVPEVYYYYDKEQEREKHLERCPFSLDKISIFDKMHDPFSLKN